MTRLDRSTLRILLTLLGFAILVLCVPSSLFAAESKLCLPAGRLDYWNSEYHVLDVPVAASTRYSSAVVWRGKPTCGGRIQVLLFSPAEALDFLRARFMGEADVQAYRDKEPLTAPTQAEFDWLRKIAYEWTPRAEVQHTTAPDTRPTYRLLPTGLRSTTAITGVRVAGGSRCDINRRVSTSSYYVVLGVDVSGKPLPTDAVAVCLQIDPWKL